MCRALLVAALEKFYHSCSQGLRFIAVATVQGADDAPNVLRVPSSPPLLSAPLLQRAVSRQHAECGPQTRQHVADCNTSLGTRASCVYQSFRRVLPPFPEASVVAHAPEVALFCAPRVSTRRPCVPRMSQAAVRTARRQWAPVPSAPRGTVLRHPARRPSWLLGLTGRPGWAECIPRTGQTRR